MKPIVINVTEKSPISIRIDSEANEQITFDLGRPALISTSGYPLQEKTATPTSTTQTIEPNTGFYGLSRVRVNAIPQTYQNVEGMTATSSEIVAGKTAMGWNSETQQGIQLVGTMIDNGALYGYLTGLGETSTMQFTIPAGYTNGGLVQITSDIENILSLI